LPLLSTHAIDNRNKKRQVIFGIGGEMPKRLADLVMSKNEENPVILLLPALPSVCYIP